MQTTTIHPAVDEALAVARAQVYNFLAAALADPARAHFKVALDRKLQTVAVAAAGLLAAEAPEDIALGPGECSPKQLDLLLVVQALDRPLEELAGQHQQVFGDRKSTRLNSSHIQKSRMPSSA